MKKAADRIAAASAGRRAVLDWRDGAGRAARRAAAEALSAAAARRAAAAALRGWAAAREGGHAGRVAEVRPARRPARPGPARPAPCLPHPFSGRLRPALSPRPTPPVLPANPRVARRGRTPGAGIAMRAVRTRGSRTGAAADLPGAGLRRAHAAAPARGLAARRVSWSDRGVAAMGAGPQVKEWLLAATI